MATENKDGHHEDVFDSLQGASSLSLLKKISIAAVAIALIAFFLFWSRSSSTEEKTTSQDTSGPVLRDRITSIEEEIAKMKEEIRKISPSQYSFGNQEIPKQDTLLNQDTMTIHSPIQSEGINLKSLFEEELQTATSGKEMLPEETQGSEEKEIAPKAPSSTRPATQASTKAEKSPGKSAVYVVKKGDTLSKISQKFYGSSLKWKRIVDANKATLGHNNMLKVGMKLTIPLDD